MKIRGRIVNFIENRKENGYAKFVFKSDYNEAIPRFKVSCCGLIPDVVAGVPLDLVFNDDRTIFSEAYQVFDDWDYNIQLLTKIKGITAATAEKILNEIGGDLQNMEPLLDNIAFWKKFRGSKRYIKDLRTFFKELFSKNKIFQKYRKYGIGYAEVDKLIRWYGDNAERMLLRNPYLVMRALDSPFITSDTLAKDMGISGTDSRRIQDIVTRILIQNEQEGNTAMGIMEFYQKCLRMMDDSAYPNVKFSLTTLEEIIGEMDLVYIENGLCGFMRMYRAEKDIAWRLKRISETKTSLSVSAEDMEDLGFYNEEQQQYIRTFAKNSLSLLLGPPGTGKTYTICGAIKLMLKKKPDAKIYLSAPTARAAGILKEKSGQKASTIHSLLGLQVLGGNNMEKNEDNPIDADLIIVDEMSMVGTKIFSRLLRAITPGTKVALVGDPNQLESVEAGSVLRDLIHSDFIPAVELMKIMRQEEGSAIIENCARVRQGRCDFVLSDSFIHRKCLTEKEGLAFLFANYSGKRRDSQIISTTKKGLLGTESINKHFEQKDDSTGIYIGDKYFHSGDKVVFIKNNYADGYCNGDVGYIDKISETEIIVDISDEKITLKQEFFPDLCHAECMTVHKTQGGEFNDVFILLPDNPASLLCRNILNTGLSRARNRVFLIEIGNSVQTAVSNIYQKKRSTRLQQILASVEEVS